MLTFMLLAGAAALTVYGIRHRALTWHYTQLLRYQFDKLTRAGEIKILLVGDSSLGNAIDARAWSSALGKPVLSLALTGAYGYGGSLNMIRNALRHSKTIETIVLFHYTGMPKDPPSYHGMILTADRWEDLDLVPFSDAWSSVINLSMAVNVAGSFFLRSDRIEAFADADYVPQGPAMVEDPAQLKFEPTEIREEHLHVLSAIAKLCEERSLRCLYVQGPVVNSICENSRDFIAATHQFAAKSGLQPVSESPLCMPRNETGDTENHVAPQFKQAYSARYLRLIAPYLIR